MISFDTNYLIRHLVRDDPGQCDIVEHELNEQLREGRSVFLCDPVLCETAWVLGTAYGADRNDIYSAILACVNDPAFCFEDQERTRKALNRYRIGKADFPDYLIEEISRSFHAELKTFDRNPSSVLLSRESP
jgi:predicted nucleic-acid-binding protein